MGFNKRHINKKILIEKFKLEGYKGVIDYVGKSEALIDVDDDIQRILDITYCDDCPTKKNIEIKKLINGE